MKDNGATSTSSGIVPAKITFAFSAANLFIVVNIKHYSVLTMVAQISCQTLNKEVHICINRSCSYLAVFGYTNPDYHIITLFGGCYTSF